MSSIAVAYGMDLGSCHDVKTVLLIDDDPVVRGPLSRYLEQEGWTVLQADDGDRGLALFRKHRPDVIVTDLLMPNVNGFQVISELRKDSEARHVRIIALSSKSFPSDKQKALKLGADLFLEKPVSPPTLSSLLSELTSGAHAVDSTAEPQSDNTSRLLRFSALRGPGPAPGPSTVFYGGNTSSFEVPAGGGIINLHCGTPVPAHGAALGGES